MAELQRCPVCSMTICIRCSVLFISLCALNEVGGGGGGRLYWNLVCLHSDRVGGVF